jgi:hypothetical protein
LPKIVGNFWRLQAGLGNFWGIRAALGETLEAFILLECFASLEALQDYKFTLGRRVDLKVAM